MKHLILFSIFILVSTAAAAEVTAAKIDGEKKALKLNVSTDCNNVMPTLHFDADQSAEGDPVYDLDFATTLMACPDAKTREQKVEVKLPPRSPGEHVIIRNDGHDFAYDVANPQEDIDFHIGNPEDDDIQLGDEPKGATATNSKLILHIFSDAIR